jgi:hypothetical protein
VRLRPKQGGEALHLFLPVKRHELGCDDAWHPLDGRPGVPPEEQEAGHEVGSLLQLSEGANENPEGVSSHVVGFASVVEVHHQRTVVSGAEFSVMKRVLFGIGASLPALHPGRGDGDPVDGATLDRDVASDLVEAGPAKQLAGPRDVIELGVLVGVGVSFEVAGILDKGSTGDAEFGVLHELAEKKLEVTAIERQIGVQIADHIVVEILDPGETGIERVGFGGELAVSLRSGTLRHAKQFDPWMDGRVLADNFIGAIRGTIADNDPAHGSVRLRDDGLDRAFDEVLLVARRGDQSEVETRPRLRGPCRRRLAQGGFHGVHGVECMAALGARPLAAAVWAR